MIGTTLLSAEQLIENTEKINKVLEKIENDKKDLDKKKKKSVEEVVDEDTFIKTRKINFDEIAEEKYSHIDEEPELSKKELKKLAKEEKKKAKKEAKEQKKLLDRDEF